MLGEIGPMARKLKTYQTSLGFFEQAIAAPSMKAALEAWGADSNPFHQGAAKESTDPDVIAATMAKPGVVLKRPVGTDGRFGEHAELPTNLGEDGRKKLADKPSAKAKKSSAQPDKATDRKAAKAYERERQRRERGEAKEEAAQEKEPERRRKAVANAQAALNEAMREYEERAETLNDERNSLEKRLQAENERWALEKKKLESGLRRAGD
jgi:hypothetical protein